MEKYKELSRGIDYLTVRIPRTSILWEYIFEINEGELYKVNWLPYVVKWTDDCTNNKAFRVLRILDTVGNRLGQIKIVKEKGKQQIYDEISLQGAYFMGYGRDLKEILYLFDVDIEKNHGLSRIDFRFDLLVSSHKVFSSNFYKCAKPIRTHRTMSKVTWCNAKTERVELCAYDKKLDILENDAKKLFVTVDWYRPYEVYENEKSDITRIEYRKNSRALRETKRTILEEMAYGEADAIEYARENFWIVIENRGVHKKYKEQTEQIVQVIEQEKVKRALQMIEAYTLTVDKLGKHTKLVDLLYDRYGCDLIRQLQDKHFTILENDIFSQPSSMARQ